MQPRLPSAVITRERFAREVFGLSGEALGRLPMQWRCALMDPVTHRLSAAEIQDGIAAGRLHGRIEPQHVYDVWTGHLPPSREE